MLSNDCLRGVTWARRTLLSLHYLYRQPAARVLTACCSTDAVVRCAALAPADREYCSCVALLRSAPSVVFSGALSVKAVWWSGSIWTSSADAQVVLYSWSASVIYKAVIFSRCGSERGGGLYCWTADDLVLTGAVVPASAGLTNYNDFAAK